MKEFGAIIQLGNVLVSEEVISEFFACDYAACRGRCCIEGDAGAPLKENEPCGLERDYPTFSPLMTERGRKAVETKGFFELDRDSELVTPVVEGSQECAYTHFPQGGGCLCAIEKSGRRKPLSCRLYPIRATDLTGGGLALNYHRWAICAAAEENGRKMGIRVFRFLRDVLTDEFGEEFYNGLEAAAKHLGYE